MCCGPGRYRPGPRKDAKNPVRRTGEPAVGARFVPFSGPLARVRSTRSSTFLAFFGARPAVRAASRRKSDSSIAPQYMSTSDSWPGHPSDSRLPAQLKASLPTTLARVLGIWSGRLVLLRQRPRAGYQTTLHRGHVSAFGRRSDDGTTGSEDTSARVDIEVGVVVDGSVASSISSSWLDWKLKAAPRAGREQARQNGPGSARYRRPPRTRTRSRQADAPPPVRRDPRDAGAPRLNPRAPIGWRRE